MERTFIMVKPDGVKRRIIGEIISRFEKKGFYLVQSKVCIPTEEILSKHYSAHTQKPFYKSLVSFMESGQVFCMVWEGVNCVKRARDIIGATDSDKAAIGTIRADFAMSIDKNIIHGSDSVAAAEEEIKIWFGNEISPIIRFDEKNIY